MGAIEAIEAIETIEARWMLMRQGYRVGLKGCKG
jgi:hypothetical protein